MAVRQANFSAYPANNGWGHQTGSSLDWVFQPLNNYIVNPLTDLVTHRIAMPTLKKTYSFFGNTVVQLVRKAGWQEESDWLEENLKDPLSTQTLLKLGERTQDWSLQWGQRRPNSYPVTAYLDICSIIAARHLYIFASDMQVLLSASQELKVKAEGILIAAKEEISNPSDSGGNERNSTVSTRVNRFIPDEGKSAAITKLNDFEKETKKELNALEKTTRQKIVQKGVEFLCSSAISSTVRTTAKVVIAIGCYKVLGGTAFVFSPLLREEFVEMGNLIAKTTSAGITSIGSLLFFRCSNTMNNFFSSRQLAEVKASSLRELAPDQEYLDQMINKFQSELGPFSRETSSMTPFAERAKEHPMKLEFEDGSRLFFQNQNSGGMV